MLEQPEEEQGPRLCLYLPLPRSQRVLLLPLLQPLLPPAARRVRLSGV
jgi:hypothetical protein